MKKTFRTILLAALLCFGVLSTGVLAEKGGTNLYYFVQGGEKQNNNKFIEIEADQQHVELKETGETTCGWHYIAAGDNSGVALTVSGTTHLLLKSSEDTYNLTSITGTEEGTNALSIYLGHTDEAMTGSAKCTIGSISNVSVTLYGGTFTSLPESGWKLGDGFCFRTGTDEAGYTYGKIFSENATVVPCPHKTVGDDGKCTTCDYQYAVCGTRTTGPDNQEIKYYTSVTAAMGADEGCNPVKLLADCDETVKCNTGGYTFDLNGHRLSALSVEMKESTEFSLTIEDNSEAKNGAITTLTVNSQTTLKGGNFGTINLQSDTTKIPAPAKGYAYQSTAEGGAMIKLRDLDTKTELTNVKVVPCTSHSYDGGKCEYCWDVCEHTNVSESGKCGTCGKEFSVKMVVGENKTYYTTVAAAVEALNNDPATITLLGDVSEIDESQINISVGKTVTLDLKGHTLTLTDETLHVEGNLTVKSTGGDGTIGGIITPGEGATPKLKLGVGVIVSGKITSGSGAVQFNQYLNPNTAFATRNEETGEYTELFNGYAEAEGINSAVKVISHETHNFVDSECACGYVCYHTVDNEQDGTYNIDDTDGKCKACQKQFVLKDGNGNYYDDISDTYLSISNNNILLCDVTKDITLYSNENNLDLNGHKLDGTISLQGANATPEFTLKDTKDGGSLTALNNSGGGEISVYDGHVGTLTGHFEGIQLYGGTYDKIEAKNGTNLTTLKLLPAGYAFQRTDSSFVKLSELGTELTNVKVVKCTHSTIENGICAYCGNVSYLWYDDLTGKWETKSVANGGYTLVTSDIMNWHGDCYVVSGEVTNEDGITFTGADENVTLILCDGAELTINNKLFIARRLDICGQTEGSGKLTVTNNTFDRGGNSYGIETRGNLFIHGGTISATSGSKEAESGDLNSVGIEAEGGITIYGGAVTAQGGTVKSSGDVQSTGIHVCQNPNITGGEVTVTGGKVTATGGEAVSTSGSASSYGIYYTETNKSMTISGGSVNATAAQATGSTAKSYGIYTPVEMAVSGGKITVKSGEATNSGGVYCNMDLSVSGGTIKLPEGSYIAGELKIGGDVTSADLLPNDGTTKYGFRFVNNGQVQWHISGTPANALTNVTVKPLPIKSLSISGSETVEYGKQVTLTAEMTYVGILGELPQYDWAVGETTLDKSGPKLTEKANSVGSVTYTCTVTVDGYSVMEKHTVNVTKATLVKDTDYSDPTAKDGLTYNAQEQELVNAPSTSTVGTTVYYSIDRDAWNSDISKITATNAGTYTVYWYIDGGTNYNDVGSYQYHAGTIEVTIEPVEIKNVYSITATGFIYDGTEKTPTITIKHGIKTPIEGKDYTVTVTPQTDAGSYDFTITGKGNYTGTKTMDWSISKATYSNQAVSSSATIGAAGTVDLSNLIMPGGTAAASIKTDTDKVLNGTPTMDGNKLQFTLANDAALVGKTADIEVSVTGCRNYENYNITVTLTATDKLVPTVTANNITRVYTGEPIPASAITGTAMYEGKTVAGTWSFTNNKTFTDVSDSAKAVSVTFTPNDTNFAPATATIKVTITKATLPQPNFGKITEAGKTLIEVDWELDGVLATLTWDDSDSTSVEQGKSYAWTLTPDDTDNYKVLTGTYIPWPAPVSVGGGGGGSSSSSNKTETTTNPDGSTTTTVTDKKTGTVTETTKNTDGSTTTVETKKDGTVTETNTTPNGTTSTTVTDKDGDVTGISASIPASAAKNGEKVKLPINEVNTEKGTTIDVEVPAGGVTVEVPVEDPTAGTVIVIVDEDGNETVVPTSKVTENGIEVTLTEDATIKVIDNAKDFSDVEESDYFGNAVDWASSRGITGGTGADTFSPDASCGRAQLVTFLWRTAGCPEAKGGKTFDDVSEDTYYTEAVKWAANLGIVGGYDNGLFGTNDAITREQMAVMLYRFAKAMGMDTTQGGMAAREFGDFEEISDYAVAAVQWAVNAGIMQGYDGNLMPGQPCTRAQIVTMLYRLLGN